MNESNKIENRFRTLTGEEEKRMNINVDDVVESYLSGNQQTLRESVYEVHGELLKQVRKEKNAPKLKSYLTALAVDFFKKNNRVPSADELFSIAKGKDKLDEEKEERAA